MFEASADGQAWVDLRRIPTPGFLAAASLEVAAGLYQAESAAVGVARFGHLLDCTRP